MRNDNTMMHILRLTVTLLAICAVVAAVLAGVNMITKDKIAQIQAQKTEKAIHEVLPDANGVQQLPLSGDAGIVQAVYAADSSYAVQGHRYFRDLPHGDSWLGRGCRGSERQGRSVPEPVCGSGRHPGDR